jgi:hypothetical protein
MRRRDIVVALAAGVIALAVLHVVLVTPVHGFMLSDTTGYLANARWIAGKAGTTWQGPSSFYHPAWSFLVAPLYAVLDTPRTIQIGALLLNGVLSIAVFPAAYALGRRAFALPPRPALVAAAIAATYPAVVLLAGYEWGEALYQLLFVGFVLAAASLLARPSIGSALAVGASAPLLEATHPRGLGVIVVAGVTLAVVARRERRTLVGLVPLVALYLATRLVDHALLHAIYAERSARVEGDVLGRLTDPHLLWGAAKATVGQLWYLTVATFGLAPLGALWLATTKRIPRALGVVTLSSCLAMLAASALEMSDGTRVDHMVYGRYMEGAVPVLLVAGAAAVLAWQSVLPRLLPALAGLATLLAVALVVVRGGQVFSGDVMPLNVTGILVYRHLPGSVDVARVTVLALLLTAAVLLLARWRAVAALVLVVGLFTASSVAVQARTMTPFDRTWSAMTRIPETVRALTRSGAVSYDGAGYDGEAANFYQLELADRGFRFVDSRTGRRPSTDLVIASPQWATGQAWGARLITMEKGIYRQGLWVMPGAVQDRLVGAGDVLPIDLSAPLPARARVQRVDAHVPIRLAPGEQRTVRVTLTHRGSDSAWLPFDAVPGVVNGTVRLGSRWYIGGSKELPGQTAELDRVLLPGQRTRVALILIAPATPGRYRLTIGARQEGIVWFDRPRSFTVEVR